MTKKEVGNRIKMLRDAKGWTQDEAAKLLELSRSTYTNYECGVSEPNLSVLVKLATLYEITVDWIIGNDGTKKGSPPENRWKALEDMLRTFTDKEINDVLNYIHFIEWKRKQVTQKKDD